MVIPNSFAIAGRCRVALVEPPMALCTIMAFSKALADLAEVYVNDAFGAAHRAHASTVGVANYLPAYAGMLMAREIENLSQITNNPERPFTVIIGGKKVSDKMPLARKLADVADHVLVGGKIAQKQIGFFMEKDSHINFFEKKGD